MSGIAFLGFGCGEGARTGAMPSDGGPGERDVDAAVDAGVGPGAGMDAGFDAPPDEPSSVLCQPAPSWLTEGETVEIDIVCADGALGRDVVIEPLPAGAVYDPATGRLRWTPELDQAAVYELSASIPDRGESISLIIGVADEWDHPDNIPIEDWEAYPLEYGVPVFILSPPPEDDDDYEPTTIVYGGHRYDAKAKKRGSSSKDYPKNSYTLKFPWDDLFSDPDHAGGFMGKRKVVLTTTFDDNSYARQRMAFELWNRLDPEHIHVQSFMAVVYLEDELWGLYTVTDHIDGELMESQGLRHDGNLYKAHSSKADFRMEYEDGEPKEDLHRGFEKKEGYPEDGDDKYADLEDLIRFVSTADDEAFERELGMRIDLGDYQDWKLMVSFMAGRDNAANNVYHYHDPGTPWLMVMWDFNATFGQSWRTTRVRSNKIGFEDDDNQIFERFLEIPAFADQIASRYRAALDSVFSLAAMHALLDQVLAPIQGVIPRDRARWREEYEDFDRWDDRDDFTTHEEEVEYIRTWLTERWALLDEMYP